MLCFSWCPTTEDILTPPATFLRLRWNAFAQVIECSGNRRLKFSVFQQHADFARTRSEIRVPINFSKRRHFYEKRKSQEIIKQFSFFFPTNDQTFLMLYYKYTNQQYVISFQRVSYVKSKLIERKHNNKHTTTNTQTKTI